MSPTPPEITTSCGAYVWFSTDRKKLLLDIVSARNTHAVTLTAQIQLCDANSELYNDLLDKGCSEKN